MAEPRVRLSLKDVRTSVRRMQTEGEKLVTRLRRDARAFATRTRRETVSLQADLRKRAEKAIEELDARRARILTSLEERVAGMVETVVRTLNVATHKELENLRKRVVELERRLDAISRAA